MSAALESSGLSPEAIDWLYAFEAVRKRHPAYDTAYRRARTLAATGRASRVILIVGPSGVGKSTLATSLLKQALKDAQMAGEVDPSIVPAVLVTAAPPHGHSFNWKDLYIRTLEQMQEPLLDRKVWSQQVPLFEPMLGSKSPAESMSTDPLRRQLERAFRRRKTRLWIVDEAHHMLLCHDRRHLAIQYETLKSLADSCNATLVLIGTYKLLDIRDHSAQLIRRSHIVDFPSYRLQFREDQKAFKSVLVMLAKELPIALEPALLDDTAYFFRKTAGCVGILRDLLRDALNDALQASAPLIDKQILDRVGQSNRAIKRIIEEASFGHLSLEDVEPDVVEALLRKSPREIVEERMRELDADADGYRALPGRAGPPPTSRRQGVGERQPVRDRVGGAGRDNFF